MNVVINSNMLAMARGGITIEDDVQIAENVAFALFSYYIING